MAASMNCIAYNGRYLMMGFASDKSFADEKLIVPRRVSAGNFKLCGVLLAYADPATSAMMKQAMGWNFAPTALGGKIMRGIVELVTQGKLKPVIGDVVEFEEIPAAITRMRDRQTVGRTIVKLF
jgi:NADPH:quinone reductase-like Zn-dependent oxidoreductase